jgi:hypothetical protein
MQSEREEITYPWNGKFYKLHNQNRKTKLSATVYTARENGYYHMIQLQRMKVSESDPSLQGKR